MPDIKISEVARLMGLSMRYWQRRALRGDMPGSRPLAPAGHQARAAKSSVCLKPIRGSGLRSAQDQKPALRQLHSQGGQADL